ncbi:hypothetical protein [Stratiformator vulcanicus]|uniref:hypothetical protein n=1 Tax=Stratiformator vulcanicus TaxID=2527980 RepID=UPI002878077A|nr:hypothetical protein [Stratiformator vulcanicus]
MATDPVHPAHDVTHYCGETDERADCSIGGNPKILRELGPSIRRQFRRKEDCKKSCQEVREKEDRQKINGIGNLVEQEASQSSADEDGRKISDEVEREESREENDEKEGRQKEKIIATQSAQWQMASAGPRFGRVVGDGAFAAPGTRTFELVTA